MDLKFAARMIAVLATGSALLVVVGGLREDGAKDPPARVLGHPGGEPVEAASRNAELIRCRDLGMAAADDAACKKAWAENRRGFFSRKERPQP